MSPYIYTIGMLVGVVGMARTIDSVRLGRESVPNPNFLWELIWVLSLVLALTCFFMLIMPWAFSN